MARARRARARAAAPRTRCRRPARHGRRARGAWMESRAMAYAPPRPAGSPRSRRAACLRFECRAHVGPRLLQPSAEPLGEPGADDHEVALGPLVQHLAMLV